MWWDADQSRVSTGPHFALCFRLHGSLYSWHNVHFLDSREQNSSVTRVAYSPGNCHWWMTLSRTLRPLTVLTPSLLRGLVASFFQHSGLSCPLCPLYCHHSTESRVQSTESTGKRPRSSVDTIHSILGRENICQTSLGTAFKHAACLCSHLPLSVPAPPLSLFQVTKTPSYNSGKLCVCPLFTPQI